MTDDAPKPLSPQEHAIYEMDRQGLTRDAIADQLGRKPGYIRTILAKIRSKGWTVSSYDSPHQRRQTESIRTQTVSTRTEQDDGSYRTVSTRYGRTQHDLLRDSIDYINENLTRSKPIKAPKQAKEDLLYVPVMPELHLGMRAWRLEGGDDYDIDIALSLARACYDISFSRIPKGSNVLLLDSGDFYHHSGRVPATEKNGNILEVDGRWQKIIDSGILLWHEIIEKALKRFSNVGVVRVRGNHDNDWSYWLDWMCHVRFMNEPRCEVDMSKTKHKIIKFGKNLIALDHGEKPKGFLEALPELGREHWSECPYCVGYTGHLHHEAVMEYKYAVLKRVRSMAAKDAYHSDSYYMSKRGMITDVYHKEYGPQGTTQISFEEARDLCDTHGG